MTALEKLGLEYAAFQALGGRGKAHLLMALLDGKGAAVSFKRLSESRWNNSDKWDGVAEKSIATRMSWLRSALADIGFEGAIVTHRGSGYAIPEPDRTDIIDYLIDGVAA